MPADRSQLESDPYSSGDSSFRIDKKENGNKPDVSSPDSGLFDEAVSVEDSEEVPTPRDYILQARKTSSSVLSHPRLSPLDLCSNSSKFVPFDPLTHHYQSFKRSPQLPASMSSSPFLSPGWLSNSHNKAAFSSSGSLLGDLNGVPLFFMPSLSTMGDPLIGSLDSNNNSSDASSPREFDKTLSSVLDSELSPSPSASSPSISPKSSVTKSVKSSSKVQVRTVKTQPPPDLQLNSRSVESMTMTTTTTTVTEKRPKSNSISKRNTQQLPKKPSENVQPKKDIFVPMPAVAATVLTTVEESPVKQPILEMVSDDVGFIEVMNKKQKVRANRQNSQHQQRHESNVTVNHRGPLQRSNIGRGAAPANGILHRQAPTRSIQSVDSLKTSSANSQAAVSVSDGTIKKGSATELSMDLKRNKVKSPVWQCRPPSSSVNISSSTTSTTTTVSKREFDVSLPKPRNPALATKTQNQPSSDFQSERSAKPFITKKLSRTDSEQLSQQHHLLTDFMIGTWTSFSRLIH